MGENCENSVTEVRRGHLSGCNHSTEARQFFWSRGGLKELRRIVTGPSHSGVEIPEGLGTRLFAQTGVCVAAPSPWKWQPGTMAAAGMSHVLFVGE